MTNKEYKNNVRKVVKRINEGTKTAESYGTGLMTEKVLVSTFKMLTIPQLKQLRYLLNQIIKQKTISKKIQGGGSE